MDGLFDEVRIASGAARATVPPAHVARLCAGHFPGDPIVPGARLAELMAELAAGLVPGTALLEIERCVFRTAVRPDAALALDAERVPGPEARVTVTARAGARVAARATLRFGAPIGA